MSIRLFRAFAAVVVLGSAILGVSSAQAGDAWSNLKVGDWATYKSSPTPGIEAHMKWVVKSVADDKVVYTIETTTMMNGTAVGQPVSTEMTYDKTAQATAANAAAPSVPPSETEETVTVNGKELKTKVMTAETETGGQKFSSKTWTSEDVPFGIVKVEANGTVAQELVDWGHGS